MRLLFAITVCCFIAVLWLALALARRIRLAQLLQGRPFRREAGFHAKQEFFEAGEFRTPRPLRLEQEILQQKPRRPLSEISLTLRNAAAIPNSAAQVAVAEPAEDFETAKVPSNPEPIPIRPAAYATLFGQTVPIARIDSHPRATVPDLFTPAEVPAIVNSAQRSAAVEFTLHRRPPQPARPAGLRRRVDLSRYNNKDMGDLTDPYTSPLRGSGTQGPVPTNRTPR